MNGYFEWFDGWVVASLLIKNGPPKMIKFLKIIGIIILITILFRGPIYRVLIRYNEIGTRAEIHLTNRSLIEIIENESELKKLTIESISEIAQKITNQALAFTTAQASNNPNELINSKKGNCIGYSAMFHSITSYLIRKNNLQNEITTTHKIGQLHFLGLNIHQYFESPFFRDHDYNEVRNIKTGETLFIDPSLSDYLWINSIKEQ